MSGRQRVDWRQYVAADPDYHHGETCIKGTRVPVAVIVGSIADGMAIDEVINEYPQITEKQVRAAMAYAAEVVSQQTLLPLSE